MALHGDTQLRLVNSLKDVQDMVEWFDSTDAEILGLDTETSGLKIYDPCFKLRMVQIGDEMHGWAVPFERWGGIILELMRRWDAKGGQWTLHNMAYDYKVLKVHAGYEIPWHNAHDTMIMSRILFPDKPAGLKELTDRFVDPRASMGDAALKAAFKRGGWTWENIPIDQEDYWFYSALDPILAATLYRELRPQLDYTQMYSVYDLEMGVLRVMVGAEDRGLKVDLDYIGNKIEEFSQLVVDGEQFVEDTWGVNMNSNPQLVEKFTELGAKFTKFTPKGEKSVDKEQMDRFMESDNEDVASLASKIVNTRKIAKMNGSYFKNFMEMAQSGYLHPNIQTLQAKSGRMSITNPALQTLHSDDSLIRNSIVPSAHDHIICSADYDQMELRLLAHLSEDQALIDAFNNADATGGDFFTDMGRTVYDDPTMEKSDPRRARIKTLMYSSIYGAGIDKMAKSAGVSYEEMEETANKIFSTFPGFKGFMAKKAAEAEQNLRDYGEAFVTLSSGRRLPVESDKIYKATNQSIQSLGAELLKMAIMRLDSSELSQYILLPIHDEILFSIPVDKIDELFPIIDNCMSFTEGEFLVNLTAATEIKGYRWGEAYNKHPDKFFDLLLKGKKKEIEEDVYSYAYELGEDNPNCLNTTDYVRHTGFKNDDDLWVRSDLSVNYRGIKAHIQYDSSDTNLTTQDVDVDHTKELLKDGIVVRIRETNGNHTTPLLDFEDKNFFQVQVVRADVSNNVDASKQIREFLDRKSEEIDED